MSHLLESHVLNGKIEFRNRVMMSPMCQYAAGSDGKATAWHEVHYGARAVGGVGLIMIEATAVESRGRISEADLGLWSDEQMDGLRQIVDFCHSQGAKIGVQLAHAGRKAWSAVQGNGPERAVAPSPLPFADGWVQPEGLDEAGIEQIQNAFGTAAARARQIGFDVVEIHAAHGYLIHEFLSPLSNWRDDRSGGTLANRSAFLIDVLHSVQKGWGRERPLFVRVSASEYVDGGLTVDDLVEVAVRLKEEGVDLIDVSSGGNTPTPPPAGAGYQIPFAETIRAQAGIPTAAVGLITTPEMAAEIVFNGRADLVALGRELLRNPYWVLQAERILGHEVEWPKPYVRSRPAL